MPIDSPTQLQLREFRTDLNESAFIKLPDNLSYPAHIIDSSASGMRICLPKVCKNLVLSTDLIVQGLFQGPRAQSLQVCWIRSIDCRNIILGLKVKP